MCGRDYPHIDLDGFAAPCPLEFLLLPDQHHRKRLFFACAQTCLFRLTELQDWKAALNRFTIQLETGCRAVETR